MMVSIDQPGQDHHARGVQHTVGSFRQISRGAHLFHNVVTNQNCSVLNLAPQGIHRNERARVPQENGRHKRTENNNYAKRLPAGGSGCAWAGRGLMSA
jgi:hypothetical protein